MSSSVSDVGLRRRTLATLACLAVVTLAFYWMQNRLGIIGGSIALSKAVWLALAILLWILLPALLLQDRRLPPVLKAPFAALLALMGARAVAEPVMLYLLHNWSPVYGIAHDVLCIVALWALGLRILAAGSQRGPAPAGIVALHCAISGLTFLAEIYYAWYMQANFHTQGGSAVYFVPDDGKHALVLTVTACVDVLLLLYLTFFFRGWLHGKAARPRA